MASLAEKLELVFTKVKHIQEHMVKMCPYPIVPPISIEDLQWAIQDYYGLAIEKRELIYPSKFVRGAVERYGKERAIIYVWQGLDEHLKRFVAAKELSHLLIDEAEDWSPHGDRLIAGVIDIAAAARDGMTKETASGIQSERLAELAALEILYPFEFRDQDLADLEEKKHSIDKYVLEYGIPEFAIRRALAPSYFAMCREFWGRVSSR